MPGTGASIAEAVRSGTRSARQVVERYLDVAERLNPELNAFVEIDRAGALERADAVDAGLRAGSPAGPLCGVPIALKDLVDHAGHVTTAGSAFYRHRATASATVVRRLEAADAIIIGRTGLHEFAFGFSSENPWFGPVRNPWDRDLSPGGSSGGSAAAVAAGMSAGAIGTDTGGSVRVPAALCGVVGLKVTHGAVPLTGVLPVAGSLDTVGPITATVGDARLLYDAMKGFDPEDPRSTRAPDSPDRAPRLENLRVGVPTGWLSAAPTSAAMHRSFDRFSDRLRSVGAHVELVEAPGLVPDPTYMAVVAGEVAAVHRKWLNDPDKPYGPDLEVRLGAAMDVTIDQYTEAMSRRAALQQAAREAFRHHDLLLTPAVGHSRKTIGNDTMTIDGEAHFYRDVLNGYSSLVNLTGCPAIALPTTDQGAPPPSVQFLAPWWGENVLLGVGEALEQAGLIRTGLALPSSG
ncbi:MAG: amidase [bacterium]|nr:amidase [bacterium]